VRNFELGRTPSGKQATRSVSVRRATDAFREVRREAIRSRSYLYDVLGHSTSNRLTLVTLIIEIAWFGLIKKNLKIDEFFVQ